MRRWIAKHVLRPLVARDYALRQLGKRPDRFYWGERLMIAWSGFDFLPDEGLS